MTNITTRSRPARFNVYLLGYPSSQTSRKVRLSAKAFALGMETPDFFPCLVRCFWGTKRDRVVQPYT